MITTKQKILVAKLRLIDELDDMFFRMEPYHKTDDEYRGKIRGLAQLLALPDNSKSTLGALADYLNGEEELYYESF